MADQAITALEDAPAPLVGDWYLPVAQHGLRTRRILTTDFTAGLTLAWGGITGTPTSLADYGITDALNASAVSAFGLTLVDDANAAAARTTLGLGNVDNTSDANKPVSTATQTALDLKLAKASNLSDLASASTARTNLGLGALAVLATVGTSQIDNDAATYAKIQNVSAATRLLGRGSAAGAGDVEELTVGTGLSLSGTVLTATGVASAGANPSATIGLAAVNGSAATFLRSDGAPALSQAIAPTWTALHTYTATAGGISITGAPNISYGFAGLTAKVAQKTILTAASNTAPEFAGSFEITSSTGFANDLNAFKIPLTSVASGLAGTSSMWAANFVTTLGSGVGAVYGIGLEVDINIQNQQYITNGAPYATPLYITGTQTGTNRAQAGIIMAYGAGGGNALFQWGQLFVDYGAHRLVAVAAISDQSRSPSILHSDTAHTYGVNFATATFSADAFISPGFALSGAGTITSGVWNAGAVTSTGAGLFSGAVVAGAAAVIGTEKLRFRQTTDQNIQFRGPIVLADGTSITSVNDAGSTTKGLEVIASTLLLSVTTLSFGTYTAGAAGDSTGYISITDAGGAVRKLMVQA